jgi:hypothetical protein
MQHGFDPFSREPQSRRRQYNHFTTSNVPTTSPTFTKTFMNFGHRSHIRNEANLKLNRLSHANAK